MNRSPLTSLALAVLLGMLAGCGGGDSSPSPASPPPPQPSDTTPDTFSFAGHTGAALATTVTSAEIVLSGINAATSVSVTGGEYSVDGGAFTSAGSNVSASQRIRVRLSTSSQFSTATSVVLNIGGVSAGFSVTTLAAD